MASTTGSQSKAEEVPWWVGLVERMTTRFLRQNEWRHPQLSRQLWQGRQDWVQEAHRALVAAFPETRGPLQGQDAGPIRTVIWAGLCEAWRASGLGRNRRETQQDWPVPAPPPDEEPSPRPWEMVPARDPTRPTRPPCENRSGCSRRP
jgi:hypothetical protein